MRTYDIKNGFRERGGGEGGIMEHMVVDLYVYNEEIGI